MLMCDDVVHQYIIKNICIYGIDKSRHAVCTPQKKIYPTREVKVWGVCKERNVASPLSSSSFACRHLARGILHTVGKSLGGPSFLGVIFGSFD